MLTAVQAGETALSIATRRHVGDVELIERLQCVTSHISSSSSSRRDDDDDDTVCPETMFELSIDEPLIGTL